MRSEVEPESSLPSVLERCLGTAMDHRRLGAGASLRRQPYPSSRPEREGDQKMPVPRRARPSAAGRAYPGDVTTPVFYARLEAAGSTLSTAPALASWDKAGSLGQVRSAAFIAEVHSAIAEQLRATLDPLALR